MKRGWKIFWIIVGSVAGLGIVLSCVALGLGLTPGMLYEAYPNGIGFVSDDYPIEDDYDEAGIMEGDDGWYEENGEWYYDDDLDENYRKPSTEARGFSNIHRLEMRVGYCEVKVLPSDDECVWVDASNLLFDDMKSELSMEEKNGVLSVKMLKDGKVMQVFTERAGSPNYGILYLYLPMEKELDAAKLNFGVAEVEIRNLRARKLDLEVGAGECTIDDLNVKDLHVTVGAGDLEAIGKIRGNADIECGVGEVDLELEGTSEDFDYTVQCGIGEVNVDESIELSGFGGTKKINNNSSRKMKITCGVGSVDVSFY